MVRPLRLLALIACLLAGGYLWFLSEIPTVGPVPDSTTDGIVVLTGGALRLDEAAALLARGKARRLLVSGVSEQNSAEVMRERLGLDEPLFTCCVDLGYQARDTIGNAGETAQWVARHALSSLRVVTAAYHMPRSLAELRHALPAVELVPHPVFPQRAFANGVLPAVTIPLEYFKYLGALVRLRIVGAAAEEVP